LLWKKGDTILAVGKQLMVKDDPRVKLEESENGNTLVISLAEPTDAGDYLCQISAQHKPTELRHSVRVRGEKDFLSKSYSISNYYIMFIFDEFVLLSIQFIIYFFVVFN
jgi:hypothetical protein